MCQQLVSASVFLTTTRKFSFKTIVDKGSMMFYVQC